MVTVGGGVGMKGPKVLGPYRLGDPSAPYRPQTSPPRQYSVLIWWHIGAGFNMDFYDSKQPPNQKWIHNASVPSCWQPVGAVIKKW